jgi:hypothetical protein
MNCEETEVLKVGLVYLKAGCYSSTSLEKLRETAASQWRYPATQPRFESETSWTEMQSVTATLTSSVCAFEYLLACSLACYLQLQTSDEKLLLLSRWHFKRPGLNLSVPAMTQWRIQIRVTFDCLTLQSLSYYEVWNSLTWHGNPVTSQLPCRSELHATRLSFQITFRMVFYINATRVQSKE